MATLHRRAKPPPAALPLGVALLLTTALATAQDRPPIEIEVSLERRAHHEARIEITFPQAPDPLEIRMARSSPGRYALHEFVKNVYRTQALRPDGAPLELERPDPYGWTVRDHGGTVVFSYTLFGDRVDGTYSAIDSTHAHLNAPATFAWARGMGEREVRLRIDLPAGWRVSSQLLAAGDGVLVAPDFHYLMDSPIEAGDHAVYEWPVPGADGTPDAQTVKLALHHLGSEADAEAFVQLVRAVTTEEIALFGAPPRFEGGSYVYLADYLPWASGDGMEHRNSTVLTSTRPLATGALRNLGTVAHELFHAWNVERIRPRSLEPFDFERANMSGELWFGEGFTSYYDDLILARIGALGFEPFVERMSGLVASVLGSSAPAFGSPVEMSRRAPLVDAATWIDTTNFGNTFLSYYTYGAAIGLALDLELRARFERSLDDYLRAAWERFGRPERPYTNDDLEQLLGEVSGDPEWARGFFARFVHSGEMPDYRALLEPAGLVVRTSDPEGAWLGLPDLDFDGDGALLRAPSTIASPAAQAGLDLGDRLVEVDGVGLTNREAFQELLAEATPGQRLALTVEGRDGVRVVELEVGPDPAVEVVSFESAGRAISSGIERFRERWLGSKSADRYRLERYCPVTGRAHPFEYEHCPWHGDALVLVPPGR